MVLMSLADCWCCCRSSTSCINYYRCERNCEHDRRSSARELHLLFYLLLRDLSNFAIWKSIRNLVRPILDAHPFLRIGCGFASILVLLPGIAMLKSLGILNMNEFPVSYNVVVILIHGMVSVAIPVEVEQFLSKYFITASCNAVNTDANKAIHRSRGSAVS